MSEKKLALARGIIAILMSIAAYYVINDHRIFWGVFILAGAHNLERHHRTGVYTVSIKKGGE